MARLIGAVCRICRREGMKLYFKGTRCDTPKCAVGRRPRPPGEHPFGRGKPSAYSAQLREKQRIKRFYGVLESQFRRTFEVASRAKGNTGENFLVLLERRLDNVFYRSGMMLSRAQARQWIAHGSVLVNGHRVDVPSCWLKPNDVITIAAKEALQKQVKDNLEVTKSRPLPSWLEVNVDKLEAKLLALPTREDVSVPIQEQLVVELLSK